MIGSFQVALMKKEQVSLRDAYSFYFDRKYISLDYRSGQYVRISLRKEFEDSRGTSRFFSLCSSPTESDYLMITTRIIQSNFKKELASLQVGDMVSVMGPFGDFIFDPSDSRPRVFIAGGIGVTPFRSMVVYEASADMTIPITLFVSYSTYEDVIFDQEFRDIEKKNENFVYVPTITQNSESSDTWSGEKGRLDEPMIRKFVSDPFSCLYFIAGPEGLVSSLSSVISQMGVKSDMIIVENFPGY